METKTKIIATLGPATEKEEQIEQLILNGVNIFRLNLSHDSHEKHRETIRLIKKVNKKLKSNVAILTDLQGPKLRIGEVENGKMRIERGDILTFSTVECIGNKDCLYISYQDFPKDVKIGEAILIDDGKLKLEVIESDGKETVRARVIYGGKLSSRKGVNLPNTAISLPSLTEKDVQDACFAIKEGVNWIGLSFVRSAADLKPLRMLIHASNAPISIIAKVEKPEAVAQIDEIITEADAIMVARGDLGVEISFDRVPMLQKMIVRKCLAKGKPVIIATQMMESMITNFRPTRAEANDVANAVMDGADSVMLSGETSVGAFPEEAVTAMKHIISYSENNGFEYGKEACLPEKNCPSFLRDALCYQAFNIAQQTEVKAIVVFTNSGYTAMKIASYRPEAKIYAFTNNPHLVAKMALLWGTKAYYYETFDNSDAVIEESIKRLKKEKVLKCGDTILHIGNIPIDEKGSANMIRLSKIR